VRNRMSRDAAPRAAEWLRRAVLAALVAASTVAGLYAATHSARGVLPDSLDTPVPATEAIKPAIASGVARHGDRLVAVGPRGLILRSADQGRTWSRADSPLSSDLVAVNFSDADTVWAAGHDAVLLRSVDAGATWQRVLDGRSTLKLLHDTYQAQAQAGVKGADEMVAEVERSAATSATPGVLPSPFLDVWFADANEGYVIGSFGLLLRTRDGGKSWTPWIEHTDNERRYHLYGVRGLGKQRWIAGEQGLLMRLDDAGERFVKVDTPYAGTYFGLHVAEGRVLAYGLRGNAYASGDDGQSWQKVETHTDASIVSVTAAGDGALYLVSQSGDLLLLPSDSTDASSLPQAKGGEVIGAASAGSGKLALARLNGVEVLSVDPAVK
jgi:photosystem II stability/assembly factor-like uncharacterized protein